MWPHLVPESITDEAEWLGELSVREEADRCISCSAETSLECVNGGRINDTLIKTVPKVNNTL